VALIGATVAVRFTDCPAATGFGEAARMVVVVALPEELITSVTDADVLAPLLVSPLYDAVSVWLPLVSVDVLKVATPPERVTVLSGVVPSLKTTVPVTPAGVTLAVMVTDCPGVAGLGVTTRRVAAVFVAELITSVTGADVLAALVVSPLYVAVSEWVPAVRVEVANAAAPLDIVTVLRVAAPSLNVILPVAVVGITMAFIVTCWPVTAGLGRAAIPVVVVAFAAATVTVTMADVLPLKARSPLYTAVREWLPAVRVAVANEADPLLRVPGPSAAVPSLKVTMPVAVDGLTVAVRVTVCPGVVDAAEVPRVVVDVALVCPTWVTVKDWPAMVSVALRAPLFGFARRLNWTVPLPLPLLPAVITTQSTGLDAVQAHEVADAATDTLPLDAAFG
jgi:hypothetical protein